MIAAPRTAMTSTQPRAHLKLDVLYAPSTWKSSVDTAGIRSTEPLYSDSYSGDAEEHVRSVSISGIQYAPVKP